MIDVDAVYLANWTPALIVEHDRQMEAALKPLRDECAKYHVISDEATRLRFEARKLWHQNQRDRAHKFGGYSRAEKAEQDAAVNALYVKAEALDRQLAPYQAIATQLVDSEKRLRAAREREEQSLREDLASLRNLDGGLISIATEQASLDEEERRLLQRLAAIKARRDELADAAAVARKAWDEGATSLGFPGRPTVDLPPMPAKASVSPDGVLFRVKRYEKSLIEGVNATEAEIAARGVSYAPVGALK